jgi:hypothetical protein
MLRLFPSFCFVASPRTSDESAEETLFFWVSAVWALAKAPATLRQTAIKSRQTQWLSEALDDLVNSPPRSLDTATLGG